MKIGVFEVEDWERDVFKVLESGHDVQYTEQKLTLENVSDYADLDVISTFIYSELTQDVLSKVASLKMIAARAIGVDNIDADYCRKSGIQVSNVPDYGKNTVAEHTF